MFKHKFMLPDFSFKKERLPQMRESLTVVNMHLLYLDPFLLWGVLYIISLYYEIIIFLKRLIKIRIRINLYYLFYPREQVNK